MHPRTRSLSACLVALAMGQGCYTGLSGAPGQDGAGEAGEAGEAGDAASEGGSDSGDDPSPDACGTPEVGATPLTRLTRSEYDHTIVDLLGIDTHPANALPPDGVSGLFANNGAEKVSTYAVEVYRDLAESLAAEADLPTLLPCDPAVTDERECAQAFVEQLGRRAYRRDLDTAQVERLLAVYDGGRDGGSFEEGIRLTIEAVLQSPLFLYRVESGMPPDGEETVALDDFELASRLSYFLWRSMPDDELLDAASAGMLTDADAVEAQARRMIEDPRAERALLTFYGDLFALDTLGSLYKDPEVFPDYSAQLGADMRTELELFVLSALREGDARIEVLLGGSHSFVNARLAAHYGIPAPAGDEFARVELDPTRYRGLLSKPVLMSIASHDQRTSPTLRGKLVRTRMFCQNLPPPPPGVVSTVPALGELSTREWVQQRLDNPTCAACHEKMDPIGLAFEQFDATGRYRTEEDGVPVDSSGKLVETDVDGDIVGASALAEKLVASEAVGECVSRQWFEFALGRTPATEDTCTHDALLIAFADSDHDIVELMVAIATSPAFRTRRPDALEVDP
jgi:Protein of unknown function (DUF1592)/Protein of unknown function (DUF1588)/Protein of unknown function (DUF1595)/Protein of unknown function (DUF1587)/Protein of unknown function (DUF1585)